MLDWRNFSLIFLSITGSTRIVQGEILLAASLEADEDQTRGWVILRECISIKLYGAILCCDKI